MPYVCVACGAHFLPSAEPPEGCPICLDERQYVGHGGQRFLTGEALAHGHRDAVQELEPGLLGVGVEPEFAIGQRALLTSGVLWDCVPLLDEPTAARIETQGGLSIIAISDPHFYTGMVAWAERLDARIVLHEADRAWITRPSEHIELWSGERLKLDGGLELVRLGGHFEGSTVCLWADGAGGGGALLAGDSVQVVADRDRVSFMRSYPNLIPLPAREIRRMRDVLAGLAFDRLYRPFWDAVVDSGAHAKVLRSADRYLKALA